MLIRFVYQQISLIHVHTHDTTPACFGCNLQTF